MSFASLKCKRVCKEYAWSVNIAFAITFAGRVRMEDLLKENVFMRLKESGKH